MFIENQWWQLAAMLIGTLIVISILDAFSIAKRYGHTVSALRTLALALIASGAAMLTIFGFVSAAVGTNWAMLIIALCWAAICFNSTLGEQWTDLLREDDEAAAD